MRGRTPAGPEYVDHLGGSETARARAKVILETLAGTCRVQEACERLGISEPRFHQLRTQMLAAAVDSLEPQTPGRKPQTLTPADEQVRRLQQQLQERDIDLRLSQARAELAVILPRVVAAPEAASEKKNAAAGPEAPRPTATEARFSACDEEEHVKRLQELCSVTPPLPAEPRRGPGRQLGQRQREQALRSYVVTLLDDSSPVQSCDDIARRLHLAPRTLRHWRLQQHGTTALALALGRPCERAPVALRNDVIALLDELGPATGVPTLQACFPGVARAELADLVRRYRRVWRHRHHEALRVLHWQVPGAVWAIDFSEATYRVEGRDRYLLAVRDLASGQQLLWWPTPTMDAAEATAALAVLFAEHGTPLVLKADNGSPFCAEATLAFLCQAEVIPLFSPPRTPRYNGAIEAGIGSLKTRTDQHAGHHGHAGHWTLDDLSAAQAQANSEARPKGPAGPSPEELWQSRRPLSAEARALFHAVVARQREEIRAQEGAPDNPAQTRAQDRPAVRRALEELGYLFYTRRRLPLPIRKQKAANIR